MRDNDSDFSLMTKQILFRIFICNAASAMQITSDTKYQLKNNLLQNSLHPAGERRLRNDINNTNVPVESSKLAGKCGALGKVSESTS